MKNPIVALIAVLALAFCELRTAAAQMPYQSGAFGNRVLGQPLVPGRGAFGGGVQTNMGGSFLFLGRPNGATSFAMPWRNLYPNVIDQAIAALPAVEVALPSQQPVGGAPVATPPDVRIPAVQIGSPAQLPPPGNAAPAPSPEQGAGMTSGVTAGVNWNYSLGQSVSRAAFPSATRTEPFRRSPELSNRLTRIAQSRGMLAGRAIDVYVSGNVALIQGTVRTSASRALLGNVLGLEPNVSRIDNRLAVAGSGSYSSNAAAKNAPPRLPSYHPSTMPAYGP